LDEVRERVRKLKGQGYVFRKTTRRGEEALYAYDPASWKKQWVGRLTPELKEILKALRIQL
jgi:DNA-binding Lrp family transcriptional regulator